MRYVTLYRKYRPQLFREVVGQNIAVKIITNSILNNTFSHAYLFTGTRGTGKTTLARIFAKALNCINRIDFEPCNQCPNCISINNGSFSDCIEIDAASNRGINEIKQIRENIKLFPLKGKYKIYIIDEVHMLTIEAFNALLKSLEEPPNFVIFILATTDVHKVPITIQSRCQKIEFKKVHHLVIFNHLKDICKKENIIIEEEALLYLAKAANGSIRDSLSLLEEVRNLSSNVKLSDILELFSIFSFEFVYDYINFILDGKIKKLIELLNKIKYYSVNTYQFIYLIVNELKNIIYYKYADLKDEFSSYQIENYKKIISINSIEKIKKVLNVLTPMLNYYKNDNDYFIFEITSLNIAFENYSSQSTENIQENVEENIEENIQEDIQENSFANQNTHKEKLEIHEIQQNIHKENKENLEINIKDKVIKIFENDKLLFDTIKNSKDIIKQNNKLIFIFQIEKKSELAYIKIIERKTNVIIEKLKNLFDIDTIEIKQLKNEKSSSKNQTSTIERIIDYTNRI